MKLVHHVITLAVLLLACAGLQIAAAQEWNYENYAAVLTARVEMSGAVDYAGLKEDRAKLDDFVTAIGSLTQDTYNAWDEPSKIAFWLNAYNALSLQLVIENYPIKPTWPAKLRFPKNSIRQIPGALDKVQFTIMGKQMTLDELEHKTLRKHFNEPRIHMALVCAAKGSPKLRTEPYVGEKLSEQLDHQTKHFIRDRTKFEISWQDNTVRISSLFKWFGEDFIGHYEVAELDEKFVGKQRAALSFLHGYLKDKDKAYVEWGRFTLQHQKYDWSLNGE